MGAPYFLELTPLRTPARNNYRYAAAGEVWEDNAMEKAKASAKQIERVSQMEAALVRLNDAITTVEGALDTYEQMWDDYRALDSY